MVGGWLEAHRRFRHQSCYGRVGRECRWEGVKDHHPGQQVLPRRFATCLAGRVNPEVRCFLSALLAFRSLNCLAPPLSSGELHWALGEPGLLSPPKRAGTRPKAAEPGRVSLVPGAALNALM